MSFWRRVALWVLDHWYLPLLVVAGVFMAIWTRGTDTPEYPGDRLRHERKVIQAGRRAAELEAQVGRERAVRRIEEEHHHAVAELDKKQQQTADGLRGNPRGLARFLTQVGNS